MNLTDLPFYLIICVSITLIGFVITRLLQRYARLSAGQSALLVGLVLVLGMHYFQDPMKRSESESIKAGQSFRAPVNERILVRPLMTEVDFLDADFASCKPKTVVVENDHYKVTFSSCGAVISEMACKHSIDGQPGLLTLWSVDPRGDREQGGFLLALDKATPLNYVIAVDQTDEIAGKRTITFTATTDSYHIQKEFVVHNDTYAIDMAVKVKPAVGKSTRCRLFMPAPLLQDAQVNDLLQGVVFTERQTLEKLTLKNLEGRLWVMPTLFGVEDKYFVNAIVKDGEGFVERAYYRLQGTRKAIAILESPEITDERSWHLTCYCGPKQAQAMRAVDERLIATLDYGWLTPISSALFMLLQLVYRYVHNYGWAIVLVTIVLKLIMLPLSIRADRSQKRMMELQKKKQFIERKHKDNPEMREREIAELIRKNGVSEVLGLGCLPRLLQIFVFIGLNRVLSVSIDLYRAPFVGWIKNLAAPDPYSLLPISAGLGMLLHLRNVGDARQFLTVALMAAVITGVMINLAAGLVLFFCVSTWLDIAQGYLQKRVRA